MILSNLQVRRATVDDLPVLRRLWQEDSHPVEVLEKRLTEFQIVETPDGEMLGAVGLQIQAPHGCIHTEVFPRPELAAELRPRLWSRVQALARNHGLVWLWVERGSAMFWLDQGFEAVGSDALQKLPASFLDRGGQHWLRLQLREEPSASLTIEQHLELFRQAQEDDTERLRRQVRTFRLLAGVVVLGLLGVIAWGAWLILRFRAGRRRRQP